MRKKKKKLNVATEARRRARKSAVAPGTERVIEDKRRKPPKHKRSWIEQEAV
jgi:hypothetical protein